MMIGRRHILEAHGLWKRFGEGETVVEAVRGVDLTLAGGEKQRVAIARALANDPGLLLADEPTANLDSSIGREVMRRLREIAKRRDQSVLIVSHDDRIREFVDRVLWLEDGQFRSERRLVRDPVCGMEVDPENPAATATVDGVDYCFCARGCRDEFVGRNEGNVA